MIRSYFLTDLIPPPLVSLEKDQAEIEKSEKELKNLEKQFNELKSKQESELNDLKEKLSKAKEKCDKWTSDSAELQSDKDKVAVEITETASVIKTEKFELKRDFKISGQIGEAGQQDNRTNSHLSHWYTRLIWGLRKVIRSQKLSRQLSKP